MASSNRESDAVIVLEIESGVKGHGCSFVLDVEFQYCAHPLGFSPGGASVTGVPTAGVATGGVPATGVLPEPGVVGTPTGKISVLSSRFFFGLGSGAVTSCQPNSSGNLPPGK